MAESSALLVDEVFPHQSMVAQLGQRRLAAGLDALGTGGVLLDRGKAHVDVVERTRRRLTVVIHVGRARAGITVRRQGFRVTMVQVRSWS